MSSAFVVSGRTRLQPWSHLPCTHSRRSSICSNSVLPGRMTSSSSYFCRSSVRSWSGAGNWNSKALSATHSFCHSTIRSSGGIASPAAAVSVVLFVPAVASGVSSWDATRSSAPASVAVGVRRVPEAVADEIEAQDDDDDDQAWNQDPRRQRDRPDVLRLHQHDAQADGGLS